MANEYKIVKCKLDGKQSISIPIDILRNGYRIQTPVDIIVKGYLKFSNASSNSDSVNGVGSYQPTTASSVEDKRSVYPVLFSTNRISVPNGHCVITLLPRSEDLFSSTSDMNQEGGSSISTSSIISGGGVPADEQLTNLDQEPLVIKIQHGVIRTPYRISIEITVFSDDGTIYSRTEDRGTNPQVDDYSPASLIFQKYKKRTSSNFIIECYNDEEWVPTITHHLSSNNSSADEITESLDDLSNMTPFGISTLYDSIHSASEILSSEDVHDVSKTIYVFTDNESNVSVNTVDDVIDEVNSINGVQKTPIMVGNINTVSPETLSTKLNSSDTKDINKLAYLTGGQSVTVVSESFLNDVIAIFYGSAVGSVGYGTYEFTVDLNEESLINQISANFDVPVDTANATWAIETSSDGYNFAPIREDYGYSDIVDFENLRVRYIKFKITLITGFDYNDNPSKSRPESPRLNGIQIIYNRSKVVYLYLKVEENETRPYHMALSVDANAESPEQVEVGVATSDAISWDDYQGDSQPPVNQNGKVVIPLRFSQNTEEFPNEPLNKIDTFVLKAEHGKWNYFSTAILYDKNGDVIPSNKYSLRPRDGIVVLNYALPSDYVDGDYTIGILNSEKYKIGLKLTNKSNSESLDIYGIGYLYSTSKDLLPPVSKAAPEAQNVSITNESPNRFSIITCTYTYYDSNFDAEDTSKRKIIWYINGTPVKYLDNLVTWNDLNNPNDPLYVKTSLSYPSSDDLAGSTIETWAKKQEDSILHSGDTLYCEVQVTDGSLYSQKAKSDVVTITESAPVLGTILVKGWDAVDKKIVDRITTENKAVLHPSLSESFYSDSDINKSDIAWYVNDELFKSGRYGDPAAPDGSVAHEIGVNEVGKANYIDYAMRIGNTIYCQITPRTGSTVGEPIVTPVVTVYNALPKLSNLNWVGTSYKKGVNLILAWNFFDWEIFTLKDVDETQQNDQTTVKIYRKNPGTNTQFELVYVYNDHSQSPMVRENYLQSSYQNKIFTRFATYSSTTSMSSTVTIDGSILQVVGQQWYAEVSPHDSIEYGATYTSKIIEITAATN